MKIKTIFKSFCLLAMLFNSCGENNEGIHPNYEWLPKQNKIDHIFNLNDLRHKKGDSDIRLEVDSLKKSDLNEGFYVTLPSKYDIDNKDNVYVINKNKNVISVYDINGRKKYDIGGGGNGPGEFLKIQTFDFSEDFKMLYVLDALDVEVFELKDNKYEPLTTIHHRLLRAYDLCAMESGESIYVSGYGISDQDLEKLKNKETNQQEVNISGPINEFSVSDKELKKSFGFRYPSYSGYKTYAGMLSEMKLDCKESTQTVVAQLKHSPFIFGYDSKNGEQKWITKLDNFNSPQAIEKEDKERGPTITFYSNKTPYDSFYPFREIDDPSKSLVQIRKIFPQPHLAKEANLTRKDTLAVTKQLYKTLLIDTESGEVEGYVEDNRISFVKNGLKMSVYSDKKEKVYKHIIYEN